MKDFSNKLYSVAYWMAFGILCIPFFLINAILFLFTYPFDRNGVVVHLFSCFWAWVGIRIDPFWRLAIQGRSNIKWDKPYILISNHQSYYDVFVLFCLFRPYKWLAKDVLFRIPFIGWNMFLNRYISIKRNDPESRRQAFEECRTWLRRGMSVLIFPEGTRSESGHLRDFHSGAFRLAAQEKIPIVPIAVRGTRNILQKNSMRLGKGRVDIKVHVLDPFDVSPYSEDDLPKIKQQVRSLIETELHSM